MKLYLFYTYTFGVNIIYFSIIVVLVNFFVLFVVNSRGMKIFEFLQETVQFLLYFSFKPVRNIFSIMLINYVATFLLYRDLPCFI